VHACTWIRAHSLFLCMLCLCLWCVCVTGHESPQVPWRWYCIWASCVVKGLTSSGVHTFSIRLWGMWSIPCPEKQELKL
jgi:hypothetical protein